MSDFEKISQLVSQTGSGFEEAKKAYDACGGDMLAAAVMLEKMQKDKKQSDYHNTDFRNNAREAFRTTGGFFRKLTRNNLKVTGKREYFDMPLIAAVIILILLWEIAIPVIFISLLCGVKYVFCGPDFSKEYPFGITFFGKDGPDSGDKGFFG